MPFWIELILSNHLLQRGIAAVLDSVQVRLRRGSCLLRQRVQRLDALVPLREIWIRLHSISVHLLLIEPHLTDITARYIPLYLLHLLQDQLTIDIDGFVMLQLSLLAVLLLNPVGFADDVFHVLVIEEDASERAPTRVDFLLDFVLLI